MNRKNLQRANELDDLAGEFDRRMDYVKSDQWERPCGVRDDAWFNAKLCVILDLCEQRDAALAQLEALP